VRDVVDGRRRLVGLFLPALGAVVLASVAPASDLRRYVLLGCLAVLAAAVLDAVVLGVTVTRSARATLPGEPVPGLATGWYAFLRAHRARSVRRPPPRVEPGGGQGSRHR
jgi:drug/metabolite transporter (DMT)-like permease